MAELTAFITNTGVPLVAPVDAPQIEVRRNDTQAIVQAFVAMIDQANGLWTFAFAIPDTAVDYTFQVDGDPNGTGQVTSRERFYGGSLGGDVDLIDSRIDVAISTRSTPAQVTAIETSILAAIAALNNISITDVETALTNQGYTTARAALLDFLDAAISSRNSVTPLDAATDQAEHDITQAGIMANLTAIGLLNNISVGDILTAVLGSGNTVDAELSGILAMRDFIEGGRDIDFVGNDALGWQRIERTVAGVLLRRYNLFDEAGARINETVASFIGRSGMISAEVAI